MNFDLIWKTIDNEISSEEASIVKEMLKEPSVNEVMELSKQTNQLLVGHYNHKMAPSFLAQLKGAIIEEFQIPSMKIDSKPIIFFFLLSMVVAAMFIFNPNSISESVISSLNNYLPYFNIVMAMTFSGMILYNMDKLFQKKVFKRKI
jgi:hypothetical protein